MVWARNYLRLIATAFALVATSQAFAAEGGTWSVSKASGEVWIGSGDVQQASLSPEDHLKPGDTIRTGRNGRVLMVRGEESILIAPNSVVGLPVEQKEELSTTIIQRAGSILLEVEKRNVKHFEVETPYLAAVVKGTQFRVSVNAASTSVDVVRGQVEVIDFKSGQIAQVIAGQRATAFEHGKSGLSLTGSGTFNPIEQGKPRPSSIDRVPVPKVGFSVRNAANGQGVHAPAAYGKLTVASTLGEVKLDIRKVTHGLARGANGVNALSGNTAGNNPVWSSSATSSNAVASDASAANNASSNASPVAATVAAATNAGSSNAGGNGIGNAFGIGNGNGNGANGNGNGGVGNGRGNGNAKH